MIEKFHWTFDYVMWGISFTNLQMLLADTQDYFPDYSSGNNNGGGNGKKHEVVNADDPRNKEKMRQMLGW